MLNTVALPAARSRHLPPYVPQPSGRSDQTAVMAVALTTNWVSDVKEINRLLSDGVLVLLAPSGSVAGAQRPAVTSAAEPDVVRIGNLEIDLCEHKVRWQGSGLDLSEREISILACLSEDIGRAYSFADLFRRAWGSSCRIDSLVIHSAVQRIRHKLAAAVVPVAIESVRGYGFRITYTGHVAAGAG